MFSQVVDFRDESETLYQLLAARDEAAFTYETQFKRWTINDVLVHLHMWNQAADWSLHEPDRFDAFMQEVQHAGREGEDHQSVAYRWVGKLEDASCWHYGTPVTGRCRNASRLPIPSNGSNGRDPT